MTETGVFTIKELSLEQMLASGNYRDWTIDITTDLFPFNPEDIGEWEFCRFGVDDWDRRYFFWSAGITPKNAAVHISKKDPANPWQAARLAHLLTYRLSFPETQYYRKPLVCAGSVGGEDNNQYPYIGQGIEKPYVATLCGSIGLSDEYYFLAVRRIK